MNRNETGGRMKDFRLEVSNAVHMRAASSYIRMKVFVLEKALALAAEFDQNDTSETVYSVLFDGNLPVATARLLNETDDVARIGRVATLKEYRGNHLGSQVVKALEDLARERQVKQLVIHAELTAAEFYEYLGYRRVGKPYDEDGVPCITLDKQLQR